MFTYLNDAFEKAFGRVAAHLIVKKKVKWQLSFVADA